MIEEDHHRIKRRKRSMLGLKSKLLPASHWRALTSLT